MRETEKRELEKEKRNTNFLLFGLQRNTVDRI
jgi:hypothetical protein